MTGISGGKVKIFAPRNWQQAVIAFETPGDKSGGGDPPKTTFSQEELNAKLAEERRETERRVKQKLKDEDYKDYDSLKAAASELEKLKGESASETEKREKAAREAAIKERDEYWQAEIAKVRNEANLTLIQAEIKSLGSGLNFHDTEDAVLRLSDYVNLEEEVAGSETEIGFDKDGKIVGVEAALKKLAKDKPYLIKTAAAGGSSKTPILGNGGGGGNQQQERERIARDTASQMVRTGQVRSVRR